MISKDDFVKYVNSYKDMYDELNKVMDAIPYFNVYESFPKVAEMCDNFVKLISILTHQPLDTNYGNIIEHFVYETNFGRNSDVEIVDKDEKVIEVISTAEELYDYIERNLTS